MDIYTSFLPTILAEIIRLTQPNDCRCRSDNILVLVLYLLTDQFASMDILIGLDR